MLKLIVSLQSLIGLSGWSITLELKQGPGFYLSLQWGILDNKRKFDPAILLKWWQLLKKYVNKQTNFCCKVLYIITYSMKL